jgi:hypothetical protein
MRKKSKIILAVAACAVIGIGASILKYVDKYIILPNYQNWHMVTNESQDTNNNGIQDIGDLVQRSFYDIKNKRWVIEHSVITGYEGQGFKVFVHGWYMVYPNGLFPFSNKSYGFYYNGGLRFPKSSGDAEIELKVHECPNSDKANEPLLI